MPIVLGVDLGTTKITSVAVETSSSTIIATGTAANEANATRADDRVKGRSEWNATLILEAANRCLQSTAQQLGGLVREVVGIGITGQQHGTVLVDGKTHRPLTPLINWQDRRALEMRPDGQSTWLVMARDRLGDEAWKRTGCWLHPGFMATTLFQLKQQGQLPTDAQALFIMDYFAAKLTGRPPITEPSCAGSSGVFNVRSRGWDDESIAALGLNRSLFPQVVEATERVGGLTAEQSHATGLPVGIPVFAPIGDHQASFLGSVADRRSSVLVNVGTGAQAAVFTEGFEFAPPIELRPFPGGGNLLSNVGLAGGWSYQVLEQFFQDVGRTLFQAESPGKLYGAMNELAAEISAGAEGLYCEPRFSGTRLDPTVRGSISGLSPQNFTAAHLARAVLDGMGRSLHDGFKAIYDVTKKSPSILIAAGNGLRENPLLGKIVSTEFGLPLTFTAHREEAAFGAAMVASVGAEIFADLNQAAKQLVRSVTTEV
ncbi:sedoheptulokinase [Schlesneria paludicola]|uniref:sedoheptulokinase n=1 Tax=Schlesneria paludicola TaxID=360056 RepID=UPI000299D680|nr:FGGY family carbohydrate kinase [Schlesneria paludicola]